MAEDTMSFKGTLGPWQSRCDGELHGVEYYVILSEDGTEVAYTRSGTYAIKNGEANSQLIAAAPDLLATLQSLLAACSVNGVPERGARAPAYIDLMEAQAAIVKALAQ